tara:strand:- start:384 stop:2141 length:1758 start_codon:yes stop_codon:yes gene_type:complete
VSDFQKKREEYLALRKGASRASPKAREAGRLIGRTVASPVTTTAGNITEDFSSSVAKIRKGAGEGFNPRTPADPMYGGLNMMAGLAGAALSPFTGAARTVLPTEAISQAVAQRIPEGLMETARKYPRQAEAVGNVAELAGLKGSGRLFGDAMNTLAENLPTRIDNFYRSPDPASKLQAVAGPAIGAIPDAMYEMISPSAIAKKRVIGTGRGRVKEAVTDPKANVRDASIRESAFIDAQKKGRMTPDRDTVVGSSVEMQRYVDDAFDMADKPRARQAVKGTTDVPDVILDRAMKHLYKVHDTPTTPGGTQLVVRRQESGEKLQGEALGSGTATPSLVLLSSKPTIDLARKAFPDMDDKNFYGMVRTVGNASDALKVREAVFKGTLPKNVLNTTSGAVEKARFMQDYFKAKLAKNPNERQQKILDYFDGQKKLEVNEAAPGIYVYSASHRSTAQDLGGVNDFVAVDTNPKTDTAYVMISDGHDLFGMDPVGGTSLINVVPMESFKIGTKGKASAPRTSKVEPSVAKIEEITGISKRPKESNQQYQQRVMVEYKGDPTRADYKEALGNIGRTGMLTGVLVSKEQEERR